MSFQALPGFRDFYPDDLFIRNYVLSKWRDTVTRYGFVEYDAPPLEALELYTHKSGDEIVSQLFNFVDKGDRAVALRPEMTPSLARMAGARARDFKKPMKWFAVPQLFRYESPQKGRLREHFQLNCDIMGESGFGAEVEILALLVDTLRSFGLTENDFKVRFFSREFWRLFLTSSDIGLSIPVEGAPDPIAIALGIIDKMERRKPEDSRKDFGTIGLTDKHIELITQFASSGWLTEPLKDTLANDQMETLKAQYLEKLQAFPSIYPFIQLDGTIVRGLAYYTSTTFEAFEVNPKAGQTGEKFVGRAIAGGGRYDDLVQKISGTSLASIGFGMGDVVLGNMLKERNLFPARQSSVDVYVVILEETLRSSALGLVHTLRDQGVRVDYSFVSAKAGKQFEQAQERGASHAIIVAPDEWQKGQVKIKTLATRVEEIVSIQDIRSKL
ncbi:MAG: histidine--tRNA ligase [Verrucomicrobiota bacterium]|nr:histidine--tRNA ligase [Verrucomicrobiota bacterium]